MPYNAKEKILVTGGAGFIGSNLAETLIKQGKSVVIIDDFNDYYNPAWKRENIKEIQKRAAVYEADIRDKQALEDIFKKEKFGSIIHLAARAGVRASFENPHLYEEVNILGTQNLLEEARKNDIQNFIFASSSSVYGDGGTPFKETDPAVTPLSPYAMTKRSGELLCCTYWKVYGINIACLRFFTVYGEKGRPDMAVYLIAEAILKGKKFRKIGTGHARRDFTYIGDIVNGILRALEKNKGYEIINLGNNHPISLNECIRTIEKTMGKKALIENLPEGKGEVKVTYADITKAKKLLGWEPRVSFEEGVGRFVEWYKANRL